MKNCITIFRQILQLLPKHKFNCLVTKSDLDKYVKHFTTYNLLQVSLYAQITGKDSLRDIISSLFVHKKKLSRLKFSGVSRSNLSYALKNRDYRVFEALYNALLAQCNTNGRSGKFQFKNPIYALDSSHIDLCLSLFPWARYKAKKGAIKIHPLLDLNRDLPVFMVITDGNIQDITAAKNSKFPISSDSILVFDKGYIDYKWYNKLDKKGITFVTRARVDLQYEVLGQHSNNDSECIISDEVIRLTGRWGSQNYPGELRLVTYYDKKNNKIFKFLTNNFKFAASTIAKIYKSRWQIEKFFRWLKQNLKITTFFGTSRNAVYIQIWVALIYYLLLYYMKHQAKLTYNFLELSRRIREAILVDMSLLELLCREEITSKKRDGYAVQLTLF